MARIESLTHREDVGSEGESKRDGQTQTDFLGMEGEGCSLNTSVWCDCQYI